jgi:hypothetical protein
MVLCCTACLQSSEAFDRFLHSACGPRRKAMKAERQRFTFRQTRRTVPITFSIMLVSEWMFLEGPDDDPTKQRIDTREAEQAS